MASTRRRVNGVAYTDYKVDKEMSVPRRTADFLSWYASKAPYRIVPLPDLTKVVTLLPRRPGQDSKEVDTQKSRTQRVKALLEHEYGIGLVVIPGKGMRATVDDEDFSRHCVGKTAKRAKGTLTTLARQTGMVNMRNIRDDQLKSFMSSMRSLTKELNPDTLEKRLPLLPKPPEEEG
jgi:hypothetical protein